MLNEVMEVVEEPLSLTPPRFMAITHGQNAIIFPKPLLSDFTRPSLVCTTKGHVEISKIGRRLHELDQLAEGGSLLPLSAMGTIEGWRSPNLLFETYIR